MNPSSEVLYRNYLSFYHAEGEDFWGICRDKFKTLAADAVRRVGKPIPLGSIRTIIKPLGHAGASLLEDPVASVAVKILNGDAPGHNEWDEFFHKAYCEALEAGDGQPN